MKNILVVASVFLVSATGLAIPKTCPDLSGDWVGKCSFSQLEINIKQSGCSQISINDEVLAVEVFSNEPFKAPLSGFRTTYVEWQGDALTLHTAELRKDPASKWQMTPRATIATYQLWADGTLRRNGSHSNAVSSGGSHCVLNKINIP